MKFLGMKKVWDGKYLKNYELSYENKAGKLKTYEIVSRKELEGVQDLGRRASGVSIVPEWENAPFKGVSHEHQ